MKTAYYLLLLAIILAAPFQASGSPQQSADKSKQSHKTQKARPFRLFNPDGMAKPTAGYSQVAEVTGGKMVYIAGQVAIDRSGNLVGKDNFRAQVQQVFENLKAAVEAAGGDFNSVIKLNYYCAESVDPTQIPLTREVRDKRQQSPRPNEDQ